MPPDDIRTKAERLDTKTRRWRVVTPALVILLLIWKAGRCGQRRGRLKEPAIC